MDWWKPSAGGSEVLRNLFDRRQIGAYYTPGPVTEILCQWAIRSPQDLIFEPSFGGCEFLDSSIRRLENIGCEQPERQIFGCDVDAHAFEYLNRRPRLLLNGHFLHRDFLQVGPSDFGSSRFDVVIGNPPYVRHQKLDSMQKHYANEIRQTVLPSLNLQASLWAFFLIHSSQFLAEGARSAWLLPSSFIYSDYAKSLRLFMRRHYDHLTVVTLGERLFEQQGASEGTVVLAAAGWNKEGSRKLSQVQEALACSTADLRLALLSDRTRPSKRKVRKNSYKKLRHKAVRLGSYCSFRIGIVTGDSKFFLFDKDKAREFGIGKRNLPLIVSKSSFVPGLKVTAADLQREFARGSRVRIFSPQPKLTLDAASYIARMPEAAVRANLTFNKRPVWYRPLDRKSAAAFFCGMSHHGPRLVLNVSRTTCTNSLYKVSFKAKLADRTKRLLALSLLSSFSQLSAEYVGRAYSAGLLKHEPSDAANIEVLLPNECSNLKRTFDKVDGCLRAGELISARELVDEFLIENGALNREDCLELRTLLGEARMARMTGKLAPHAYLNDPKDIIV